MKLPTRFAEAMAALFPDGLHEPLGLAVSGGSDSIALMHLAADAGYRNLHVVTVDHGLREESSEEARGVAQAAANLGLPHQTLVWGDWDGQGNLQDAARLARRGLIEDWARSLGICTILTGHTKDDQAETVLMRLARGSGVDGLAGMAAIESHGVTWARPLLSLQRSELRAYLRDKSVGWVDDPSNDDARFDRVRARKMMDTLADLGLTQDRLVETAGHMSAARDTLDGVTRHLARQAVTQDRGDLLIDLAMFDDAGAEVQGRLMAAALQFVAGALYRPRYAPLRALIAAGKGTLHGCQLHCARGKLRVFRELNAVCDLECPTSELWDGRWRFDGPHQDDLAVRALGAEGLRQAGRDPSENAPAASLFAKPAIWRKKTLISAPLIGLESGWTATLAAPRDDFTGYLFRR